MVYIGFRVHIGFKVARSRCVHVFCEGLLRLSPSIASETFNLEDFGFGVSQIPVPKFGFKEGKRFKGSGILGWFVDEGTLRA